MSITEFEEETWYNINRVRLVQEGAAMKDRFPQFKLKRLEAGQLVWHGTLRSNNRNEYQIAIRYPSDFPDSAPKAFMVKPAIFGVPHMWQDGSLCMFAPFDRSWETRSTAATVVAWAAVWIFAFEIWKNTGKWPGRSVD